MHDCDGAVTTWLQHRVEQSYTQQATALITLLSSSERKPCSKAVHVDLRTQPAFCVSLLTPSTPSVDLEPALDVALNRSVVCVCV
jgi:hypothetical protein